MTGLSKALHLNEAERVVFLHEAFDATADLLKTGLVLAYPGDVLLNRQPIGVTMTARAVLQSGDEVEYFGLHLLTQPVQALLTVIQTLLNEEGDEVRNRTSTKCQQTNRFVSVLVKSINRLMDHF